MKKTLSKIKNKSSKGFEQKNDEEVARLIDLSALNSRGAILTNDINTDSLRISKGKKRNNFFYLTENSTTTNEPYTTSTSESEPERKSTIAIKKSKKNSNQRDHKYKDPDPQICLTVLEGGRGNIRIVGANNPGPSKKVDFASLDAVYGTSPENSSDEDAYILPFSTIQSDVYNVECQNHTVSVKESTKNHDPSGRQHLASDDKENLSKPDQDNNRESFKLESKNSNKAEQLVANIGGHATLALPIFSVNIHTSQEDVSYEASKVKNNTGTQNVPSQLSKLKQYILGFENSAVSKSAVQNEVPVRHTLEISEQKNMHRVVEKNGKNSTNGNYYGEDKSTTAEDLSNDLQQLMNINRENQYRPSFSQTSPNTQTSIIKENTEPENEYNKTSESVQSRISGPLIYMASLNNNTISRDPNYEVMNKDKDNNVDITHTHVSKEPSKKNSEIVGSKISMNKSKRLLKLSVPKSSVCSKKKSSVTVRKSDRSVLGKNSKTSKKYVIRDIMVIPEDQTGQQFANIYPAQPLDYDIPEEAVALSEREIRLHSMNTSDEYETDKHQTVEENCPVILKSNSKKTSIPCLYFCSTSTVNLGRGANNDFVVNSMVTCHNNKKNVASDTSSSTGSNGRQDAGKITDTNDSEPKNVDNLNNSIVIGPEIHREIMKAINASNGKSHIVTLPTKISRKEISGNRLILGNKSSKANNSLKMQVPVVDTITEEDTQDEFNAHVNNKNVKPVQIVSTDVTDITGNTGTDRLEMFEIRKENIYQISGKPEPNEIYPFTRKGFQENTAESLVYSSMVNNNTLPSNKNNRNKIFIKKKINSQPHESKVKKVPSTSFSEPLIVEESLNDSIVPKESPLDSNVKTGTKRKRKKVSKTSKTMPQSPDALVYLGALPNTTYNVFFSPDKQEGDQRYDDKKYMREVKSETKNLSPIKSEKLLAQGPKAILIFVNKKTELNRNPFDGNVVYDDDEYGKHHKGKHGKGKEGEDKYRGKGEEKDRGKGKGKDKDKRKQRSPSAFTVDSNIHKGSSRSRLGDDKVVVEKSPSGNKTITKYPCGCMKIKEYNPETDSLSEEITSAFCRLGSKCEIGQSQKDKRVLTYGSGKRESSFRYGDGLSSSRYPRCPQLDIVIEGLMSKKPIKSEPPAQTMKGTNLTGTLSIKTNRCNGVFHFYIDPRLKDYIRNNFPCAMNTRYDNRSTGSNYRSTRHSS